MQTQNRVFVISHYSVKSCPPVLHTYIQFNPIQMWGIEGFMNHVASIEAFYQNRRDIMLDAANKHLTGLAEFSSPDGGMFL